MFRIPIAGLAAGVVCATTLCQLVGSSCNFPLLRAGCWAALLDLGWLTFVAVVCARLCRLFHLRGVLAVRTIIYIVLFRNVSRTSCASGATGCGAACGGPLLVRACGPRRFLRGPLSCGGAGLWACATILV